MRRQIKNHFPYRGYLLNSPSAVQYRDLPPGDYKQYTLTGHNGDPLTGTVYDSLEAAKAAVDAALPLTPKTRAELQALTVTKLTDLFVDLQQLLEGGGAFYSKQIQLTKPALVNAILGLQLLLANPE